MCYDLKTGLRIVKVKFVLLVSEQVTTTWSQHGSWSHIVNNNNNNNSNNNGAHFRLKRNQAISFYDLNHFSRWGLNVHRNSVGISKTGDQSFNGVAPKWLLVSLLMRKSCVTPTFQLERNNLFDACLRENILALGGGAAYHEGEHTCFYTQLLRVWFPVFLIFFRGKYCRCCWGLSTALLRGKWTAARKCWSNLFSTD